MEVEAELFDRSAVAGAGIDRRRQPGQDRGAASVSVSYIDKALARRDTTGETEVRPQRNRQTLKLAAHHAAIAAEVARRPDAALEELRAWLRATHPSRPAPPGCSCSSPGRFRSPQSAWSVPLLRLPTEPSTGEVEGRAIP